MKASTVNALLNGNRGISAEEYFKICDTLKVPLEYFRTDIICDAAATADDGK